LFLALRPFRLARGPDKAGLRCDADGVSLGGVQLLRKSDTGFAPRSALEIDVLTKAGYGAAFDAEKVARGLAVASRALNDGDLGRAMVATLHLRLPELDAVGASRLAAVDAVLAKYSPDQPRDWHGRWTSEGEGSGGPGQATETRRPAARQNAPHHEDHPVNTPSDSAGRDKTPSGQTSAASQTPANATQSVAPSGAAHQESHPTGGHLIDARYQAEGNDDDDSGIGDNRGPPLLRPEGPQGAPPEPDPILPIPKVPPGWDQPYRVVNGVGLPAGRYPKLPDGRPWPTAEADEIYRMLDPRRGGLPFVKLYVPIDGKGPMLMGTTEQGADYIEPPGYQTVYLRGIPQRTTSGGVDTAHALECVTAALRFAEKNEYSDIFFNRSFSTISNGEDDVPLRPDVVGLRRPTLDGGPKYDVFEVLSPRQSGPAREEVLRPAVLGIGSFNSQAYKLLLKLLRALGISWR
jgi:hypothetical protein